MNALRNGKVREYPPPTAKKRRNRTESIEEVQSTTTEDSKPSAESQASEEPVHSTTPDGSTETHDGSLQSNASVNSNNEFTTPLQSPATAQRMTNTEDPPPSTSRGEDDSDLFSQAFDSDDPVEDEQAIIESNARFNVNRALDLLTSLINEAAALALSIQSDPQGKLAPLEEFLPQFDADTSKTAAVAQANVDKIINDERTTLQDKLNTKKGQVLRISNRLKSKVEVLKVQQPIPVPQLLQLRQNTRQNLDNGGRAPVAPHPNGTQNEGSTINGILHHGNGLLSNLPSQPSGNPTPRVNGILNPQARPFEARSQLRDEVYTQQNNPHNIESGQGPAPRFNRPQRLGGDHRRQYNNDVNGRTGTQYLQQNIAKSAVAGEDGMEEVYFNVNDRRNVAESKFPPIMIDEDEFISEEYFFSTFPAPFNTPPHKEQNCDNGELLQTARNLAPKIVNYEQYSKFMKNFKVTIHAVRMDYELKINCLKSCFPDYEFFRRW